MNRKTTVAILATCLITFGLSAASCQETVQNIVPDIQGPGTTVDCYAGPGHEEQPGLLPCEPSNEGTGINPCFNLPPGAPGCPPDPLPPPECPEPVDCTGTTERVYEGISATTLPPTGINGQP